MIFGLDVKTIIKLLLDFAPTTVLDDLELTESTRDEWEDDLESERGTLRGNRSIIDMSSLALYYAARKCSLINNREKLLAYGRVEVDLYTLYDFAEMVKAEDFDKIEEIVKGIAKVPAQKRMAKAQEWLVREKYNWEAIFNFEAELLRAGVSQRDLAGKIEARMGVSPSRYREKRRERAKQTTV
jgi:hypothetical protein